MHTDMSGWTHYSLSNTHCQAFALICNTLLVFPYAGMRKLSLSVSPLALPVRPVVLVISGQEKSHLQLVQLNSVPEC